MALEYFKSNRGALKLAFQGYRYTKEKKANEHKIYWRCENRDCKGRVTTVDDVVVKSSEHNMHAPDLGLTQVKMSVSRMKGHAGDTREATATIVARELADRLPTQFRPLMPSESTIKRALQRERKRKLPALPKTLSDVTLLAPYTHTKSGDNWVLVDETFDDGDRLLVLCSNRNLCKFNMSCHCLVW
jgi:hypothetical protein